MAVGKYPVVDSPARPWPGFAVDWVLLDLTRHAELLWPRRGEYGVAAPWCDRSSNALMAVAGCQAAARAGPLQAARADGVLRRRLGRPGAG
jgi:hypothetical protein